MRVLAWVVLAMGLSACVDVEKGDVGVYITPCGSSFKELVQCGRESGGADPEAQVATGTKEHFTCRDACQLVIMCVGSGDEGECVASCEGAITQTELDCIRDQGCNFATCFPQGT